MLVNSITHHHALIARPLGLPGYEPIEWCAVCGKTSVNKPITHCTTTNCPNVCHNKCLGQNSSFECSEVGTLRHLQSISDAVTYVGDTPQQDDVRGVAATSEPNQDDDLLLLEPRELVSIIRQLRSELKRKKSILSFFGTASQSIAEKRDAVVTILDFIDNLTATKSSLDELDVKSIATSARSEKIDKEWQQHINTHRGSQAWWVSNKPRPLQAASTQHNCSGNSAPIQGRDLSGTITSQEHSLQTTKTQLNHRGNILPQQSHNSPAAATIGKKPSPFAKRNTINPGGKTQRNKGTISAPHRHHKQGTYISVPQAYDLHVPHPVTRQTVREYCQHCRRSGHTEEACRRKTRCSYCHRQGHTTQECRTRLDQERQERFFQKLTADQAQNNAVIIQSLNRYFVPPTPHNHTLGTSFVAGQTAPQVQPFTQSALQPYFIQGSWNHASQQQTTG